MIDLGSDEWATALRDGLGARWMPLSDGGSIACFRAGPFRVAYPDFLIGSHGCVGKDEIDMRIDAARSLRADLVRIQAVNAEVSHQAMAVHALGSTVIPALSEWDERQYEKGRRAANRESRSELILRPGCETDGGAMYKLYLATIRRRGGAVRYGQRYFELIAPAAATVAELDGNVCGFVCVGFHKLRACYMHGAHALDTRQHYPSDQLFLHMLREARDAGMSRFDFLASPAGQPSLLAYKKAWGGVREPLTVTDIAINPVRARGFNVAIILSNALASMRRA